MAIEWRYDAHLYKSTMRDPSNDRVGQDEHGQWRILVNGEPGNYVTGLVLASKELAENFLRRRQAIFEWDFAALDALEAEAAELRRRQ